MSTTRRQSEASGAHVLAIILSIAPLMIFHGWALKTAWNWFVPAITGWAQLGIAQAIGIAVVLGIARSRRSESDENPAQFWLGIVMQVLTVLLTLGIGWIVHEVMA
jgi:hypothetical protein